MFIGRTDVEAEGPILWSHIWYNTLNFWLSITFLGFPSGSAIKNLPANAGDMSLIPGSGRPSWRRKWQLTPVVLPGKSRGQRSLVDYRPCSCETVGHTDQVNNKLPFYLWLRKYLK